MGVVFFVGFLIVLFFIGLFLLSGFLAFLLLGLIGGHKHKKMYFFLIPSGILFLLGGCAVAAPLAFTGAIQQMNAETYPLVGHYIDQSGFQSESFSVDGVTYDSLAYKSYFKLSKAEAFCTYRRQFLFLSLNDGYYFRTTDSSLGYTLVTSYQSELFTKREDHDRVYEHYRDGVTHWTSYRTGRKLGDATDAVDMEALRKQEAVQLPYTESQDKASLLSFVSEDGYVCKDGMTAFLASDEFYYLRLGWIYGDLGIEKVEAIKLPDVFQTALKEDAASGPAELKFA